MTETTKPPAKERGMHDILHVRLAIKLIDDLMLHDNKVRNVQDALTNFETEIELRMYP